MRGMISTTGLIIVLAVGAALGIAMDFTHRASARSTQDLASLSAAREKAVRAKLMGNWVAPSVPSLIGPLKVEMDLRENNSCHVNVWTTGSVVAHLRDKEGVYQLKEDRICSELLKRGSVKYWFDGDKLMMEYKEGTIVAFNKAS